MIDVRDANKRFVAPGLRRRDEGPVVAVDHVSFSVGAGEILAVVGESGAGKSTVGRMLLGLERPDSGEVWVDGHELGDASERALRRIRRRMSLVLQDPYQSLHPGWRVRTAVAEPLAIAGVSQLERSERAASALEEVGLAPAADFVDRFPHELSGGQRQRVAFARALAGRPRVVVADEPTSMLDASLRRGILDLITAMRERLETTFVVITHDLAAARYVADRVVVMLNGQIVESGEIGQVLDHPANEYTKMLLAASEGRLPEEASCG
ncbi:MAG: dipeptide/oligopeptide/nickel ABC transporter ATP-binding protein [Solirubrobacteraceae bacterium MAG38_C4-C5]|nr:dipeptide/oligopeptide/nickel ABC transporter ATP-binding protein [Candidatus Siliceabacter maunaloa]